MKSIWAILTCWLTGNVPFWRWTGKRWQRSRFAWAKAGDRFRFGRAQPPIEGTVNRAPYLIFNPERGRLEWGLDATHDGDS